VLNVKKAVLTEAKGGGKTRLPLKNKQGNNLKYAQCHRDLCLVSIVFSKKNSK
jgi:hypothetical protein